MINSFLSVSIFIIVAVFVVGAAILVVPPLYRHIFLWSRSYKAKPPVELDGIATADVCDAEDSIQARFDRAKANRARYLERSPAGRAPAREETFDPVAAVDAIFSTWKTGDKASKLFRGEKKKPEKDDDWDYIEEVNKDVGIDRGNAYLDDLNYLRWKSNDRLCHRDIAYEHCTNDSGLPFRYCDVHHVDGNKWNDAPENLEILSREAHEDRHDKRARHRELQPCWKAACTARSCTGCPYYNEFDRVCQK